MTKRKPKSEHQKRGRPSLYRDEYAKQALRLCLLGATDAEIARFFEVAVSTVALWKVEHPEFSDALKAGKEQADALVAQRLYKRALGYEHRAVKITTHAETGFTTETPYVERYPPDTTAAIFWLKNRRPDLWRDQKQIDHAVHISLDGLPKEALVRIANGEDPAKVLAGLPVIPTPPASPIAPARPRLPS